MVRHAVLPGRWGQFAFTLPDFNSAKGAGPWEGHSYVMKLGQFGGFSLKIHQDLNEETKRTYGTNDDAGEWNRLGAGNCSARNSLGTTETVPGLNGTCGKSSAWQALVTHVKAHERKHQLNYNQCARSSEAKRRLNNLEALLGTAATGRDFVEAKSDFHDLFTNAQNVGLTRRMPFDAWWHAAWGWDYPTYADGHPGNWTPYP